MNHQPTLCNSSQPVPQRLRVTWQKRLSLIVLTLGSLLFLNAVLFARIAHATPTPEPPDMPAPTSTTTSTATSVSLPTNTPAPAPPPRSAVTGLHRPGLVVVAFGGLLLISTVFMARMPVAKARRRDEHDE